MLNDGKVMNFANMETDNRDLWGAKVLDQNTHMYITEKQFVHATEMGFIDYLMEKVHELVLDEEVMDKFIEDMGVKVSPQGREVIRYELAQRVWTTTNDLERPKWDKEVGGYV